MNLKSACCKLMNFMNNNTFDLIRRTVALRAALAACLLASPFAVRAADSPAAASWKDDFSDGTMLAKHWSSYGFLAAGIGAKNPLGKPVGGNDSRPEWWQIVDGALRGQNFPEEKHGSGISRDVAGQDVRLSCRFKIPDGGMAAIGIRGPNPILEKVFNVVSLHIRTDSIVAADNDVLHPKDSTEAAELKKKGEWNRKFYYAKTETISIAPDAWHDLAVEARGKELRVIIDAKSVLSYTTLCGDAPKTSIGFGVGGNGKTVVATWYDDVSIEPLDANK
jgi:hypothetical protein